MDSIPVQMSQISVKSVNPHRIVTIYRHDGVSPTTEKQQQNFQNMYMRQDNAFSMCTVIHHRNAFVVPRQYGSCLGTRNGISKYRAEFACIF